MNKGVVYLVGAGPGSPDLITLRALRAIKAADVLIIDALLPASFIDDLGINCHSKEIYKLVSGIAHLKQEHINDLMAQSALSGKTVARIKTGDPHLFGRATEEQAFLSSKGIRWEYIPGISVLTATALEDLPLTKRKTARSFAAVSARCEGGKINIELPKADSIVIFMGVSVIGILVEQLLADGWDSNTPVAILERVSMPWQRRAIGKLGNITELAAEKSIQAPAICIVGKAAEDNQFLIASRKILFTGLDPANFHILGNITHWQCIEAQINQDAAGEVKGLCEKFNMQIFSYLVITSKISARLLMKFVNEAGFDSRIFKGVTIITAGKGTAQTLSEFGLNADIIPEDYGSRGIIEKIRNLPKGNTLVVQSATASEAMANKIAENLGEITHLKLHKVVPNPNLPDILPDFDIVYFTCPSAVRAFYQKYGADGFSGQVWCIGDVTQRELDKLKIKSEVILPYVS